MIVVIALIGGLIVLAVVVAVFSVIAAVMAAAAALAMAALAGGAAAMLITSIAQTAGMAQPGLAGSAAGIIVFLLVAALLLRRLFGTRRGRVQAASEARETVPLPAERDAAVRGAWDRAQHLVPRAALAQVASARADCAVLLDMAEGDALDIAVIDLAALVRRNVPALVQQVDALWRNAPRAEQDEQARGLADDLISLGAAARPFVARNRENLRDRLAAIRNHVAAQTGR